MNCTIISLMNLVMLMIKERYYITIINADSAFNYVGSMHDNFLHVLKIYKN